MRLTSSPIYGGTDSGGGCSSERLNRGVGELALALERAEWRPEPVELLGWL